MYNIIKRKNIIVFAAIVLAFFAIIAISIIAKSCYIESKYNKAISYNLRRKQKTENRIAVQAGYR